MSQLACGTSITTTPEQTLLLSIIAACHVPEPSISTPWLPGSRWLNFSPSCSINVLSITGHFKAETLPSVWHSLGKKSLPCSEMIAPFTGFIIGIIILPNGPLEVSAFPRCCVFSLMGFLKINNKVANKISKGQLFLHHKARQVNYEEVNFKHMINKCKRNKSMERTER